MPKRSSKDLNEVAFKIVQLSTGLPVPSEKNPAAVALGRLGGLKGGKARAAALSEEEKKKIATLGAKSRWKNHNKKV